MFLRRKSKNEKFFRDYLEKRLTPSEVEVFETMLSTDTEYKNEYIKYLLNEAKKNHLDMDRKTFSRYIDNSLNKKRSRIFEALASYVPEWKTFALRMIDSVWFKDLEETGPYELYDEYISGDLNEIQFRIFELKLLIDNEFQEDFTYYKIVITAVEREGRQEDLAFYEAMSNVSEEEIKSLLRTEAIEEPTVESFLATTLSGFVPVEEFAARPVVESEIILPQCAEMCIMADAMPHPDSGKEVVKMMLDGILKKYKAIVTNRDNQIPSLTEPDRYYFNLRDITQMTYYCIVKAYHYVKEEKIDRAISVLDELMKVSNPKIHLYEEGKQMLRDLLSIRYQGLI